MTWISVYGAQRACQRPMCIRTERAWSNFLFYSILSHTTNLQNTTIYWNFLTMHYTVTKTQPTNTATVKFCVQYGSATWGNAYSFTSWISYFYENKYQAICCCRGNDNRTLNTLSSVFCHLSFLYCHCQHIITGTVLKEYTAVIEKNTSTSILFIL
jgi:hypothetical protein